MKVEWEEVGNREEQDVEMMNAGSCLLFMGWSHLNIILKGM